MTITVKLKSDMLKDMKVDLDKAEKEYRHKLSVFVLENEKLINEVIRLNVNIAAIEVMSAEEVERESSGGEIVVAEK